MILTADEMKDQYERAMKLHMSNKINEKNVYQLNLNLIDCIHQESFSSMMKPKVHYWISILIHFHNMRGTDFYTVPRNSQLGTFSQEI